MMNPVAAWRKRNSMTQVEAARELGVSQAYLSLLEHGARPVTEALRGRLRGGAGGRGEDRYVAQLSAWGYPGFAHVRRARRRMRVDALLLSVLGEGDVEARVAEAMPWLARRWWGEVDHRWLVRQAKERNLQNRVGFVLAMANVGGPEWEWTVEELERARLLAEATLCWDSMPAATRVWMRKNRTALAAHWNILTRMGPEDLGDAG